MKTMKKIRYIFLVLAAIFAASCSKHNTDGPQPLNPYIFFEAGMSDIVQTKTELIADDVFTQNGAEFGVLGFYQDKKPVFNGYTGNIANVYRADGVYKYDNLAVWQGTTHTFSAFYPYEELLSNVKVGTDNVPYIEYTQPWDMANMKDILGAYTQVENTNPTSTNDAVALHFQHLLWAFNVVIRNSQTVEVTASENITNPSIAIKKVTLSLKDFPKTANLKLDQNFSVSPGDVDTKNVVMYSDETGQQIASGNSSTFGPLLFIPVNGLSYKITIDYTTQGGVNDTFTYPADEYQPVSSSFSKGQVCKLTIEKSNDRFFVGKTYNSGNWTDFDRNLEHNFE